MHVFVWRFRGPGGVDLHEQEAAVVWEAMFGDNCGGERNRTERLDRIRVELSELLALSADAREV